MKKYLFLFLLFILAASAVFIKSDFDRENHEGESEQEKERGESHQRFPADSFQFSATQFYALLNQVEQMPTDKYDRSINSWEFLGPDTMIVNATTKFCGRARCVRTFTPQHQEDLGIRVSTGSGGLWNLKNVSGQIIAESLQGDLPIGDVPAFDIYPGHLDTMIAGTGEPNTSMGIGLFITYNGGLHWERTNTLYPIANCYHKILFNPEHPDTVFAASSNGLFRSTDGGNSWSLKLNGDVTDLAFNPQHPDTLYACVVSGGFYKSTDGGDNFFAGSTPSVSFGHTVIAVAPSAPDILYACITNSLNTIGIYKSINAGSSWTPCTINYLPGQTDFHGGVFRQGYYDNCITIKPTDENTVIAAGVYFARSIDGTTFNAGLEHDGHNDHHGFTWRSDGTLLDANDGGLFVSDDDGANMKSTFNYLPVSQFYEYDLCANSPQTLIGSLQDNATVIHKFSGGQYIWKYNTGGDGFSCGINPANLLDMMANWNSTLVETFTAGSIWNNANIAGITPTGYYFPRYERSTAPDGANKYGAWVKGNKQLFRRDSLYNWSAVNTGSELSGPIWYYALGNRNTADDLQNVIVSMYASDTNKIFIRDRTNGGWYNITHNLPRTAGTEYRVATAYYNNDISFVFTVSGPSMGRVYMNSDIGVTDWIDITGNLPAGMRINCLANNPYNPNEIFIGTYRFGIFRTIVGSNVWTHWVNGWPNGMDISGLEVVDSSAINGKMFLEASSYGRGMWRREITGEDPSGVKATALQNNFSLQDFPIIKAGNEIIVKFETAKEATLKIEFYDLDGHLLQTICDQKFEAGHYSLPANSNSLSSGIYLCSMLVNEKSRLTKKMVVLN